MNTRIVGAQASIAPTSIACTVVMMAPWVSAPPVAGSVSLRDRRFRAFVEPFPIGPVALQLPLVDLAALCRAKLFEVPAAPDQPERALALWISTAVCHDTASAFARRIQRMKFSWPRWRQSRPQKYSRAREIILGSSLSHWEQRGSVRM